MIRLVLRLFVPVAALILLGRIAGRGLSGNWRVMVLAVLASLLLLFVARLAGVQNISVTRFAIMMMALESFVALCNVSRGRWWFATIVPIILVWLVFALMADGFAGDAIAFAHKPKPPALELYRSYDPNADRTVIYLPAVLDSGKIASLYMVGQLRQFVNVVVVDYSQQDWNNGRLFQQLLNFMGRYSLLNPSFVGVSFGSEVAVNFMRWYRMGFQPIGPIGKFVSICGPTDRSDIINGTFLRLARYLKGGPLLNFMWPALEPGYMRPQPVTAGVDLSWVGEHRRHMQYAGVRGLFARFAAMAANQPLKHGEFADVKALIVRTEGVDALVRPGAVTKLQDAFSPDSEVATAPGVHATTVENAPEYTDLVVNALRSA